MTDRIPGAPGRCKAVVAGQELQKMQAGEEFAITLRRDDQPIKEGTPYSKATVLPDELAARLCPGVEDPSPKDAFAALHTQKADTVRRSAGEKIILHNAAHTPLMGLKLYGKTTQDGCVGDNGSVTIQITGGKNLFDKNAGRYEYTVGNIAYGAYINVNTSRWVPVEDASYSIILPCLPNRDYTFSGTQALSILRIATTSEYATPTHYPTQRTVPVQILYNGGKVDYVTVTTNSEANYMVLQFSSADMAKGAGETIQIEAGNTATKYESFQTPQSLTVPTSGGLHSDAYVRDEIDFAKGVCIKRVHEQTETALPAAVLAEYAKLHTCTACTMITNDADADMELTYYTSSTAVQMIHSPADKGKILSIDEHGCVVLTPNEIGSVKDAFRVEPHYTTFYGGGGFYAVDTERQFELEFNDWTQNRHLRGKTLHVKTYAYDNAFYGISFNPNDNKWLIKETPNPNADITKDPKSGVCEFDITIPKDIPADEVLIVSVPYAENPYTELEIYEKKDTVWDELKRLGVNHIIAYDFYDWNDEEYGYWRKWSDGFVELWMRFYGYVMEDDQNDGAAVFQLTLPVPLELDTDKRFHITMDAWGYSEEERGNKAPATYMWAEPAYEENGVTSELLVHVLSQNTAWTTVEGTAYIAGYYYKEDEGP